jgi:hypothetical protein
MIVFHFIALMPDRRYEWRCTASHLVEAYDQLKRNAVKSTGVPSHCWYLTKC